ncbi:hypothetical protein TCAL_06078 [Tigriopus californicus]|uniref:Saposin B-type domain-containing protein n=1 Tax=Tigriopus californicus TaxID=6832 RepID=A0A553P1Z8_TIGCA|nr:uncharacterized protein LOC131883854 [Tigriopus californicus]TRY71717.1 hypothetical protein TCAL_06078 [Tigriopus californicus]|eukprot:TCALIF_06078-PA protein Name:"Protein of unknown function" AED:0.00 eAED:0.00 QI:61/1/1/1/1/1/2/51/162
MARWAILCVFLLVLSQAWTLGEKPVPSELKDPFLFCDACYATITEVTAMMVQSKGSKLKQRIKTALDSVCSTDHLRRYILSPPKMTKACSALLKTWRFELEQLLQEQFHGGKESNVDILLETFCRGESSIQACREDQEFPTRKRDRERSEQQSKAQEPKDEL